MNSKMKLTEKGCFVAAFWVVVVVFFFLVASVKSRQRGHDRINPGQISLKRDLRRNIIHYLRGRIWAISSKC